MTTFRTAFRSTLAGRARRRATHRALSRLDARALEDIGMNRADVDIRFG